MNGFFLFSGYAFWAIFAVIGLFNSIKAAMDGPGYKPAPYRFQRDP